MTAGDKFSRFASQTTLPSVSRERERRRPPDAKLRRKLREKTRLARQKRLAAASSPGGPAAPPSPLRAPTQNVRDPDAPNVRAAGRALEKKFAAAMAVVDGRDPRQRSVAEAIDRLQQKHAAGELPDADVAGDYLACCQNVERAFADRQHLGGVVAEAELREDADAEAPAPAPDASEEIWATPVASAVGVTPGLWREAREGLGAAIFEQKWANETCADLAVQAPRPSGIETLCRANLPWRDGSVALPWRDGSRRRRGCHADSPWTTTTSPANGLENGSLSPERRCKSAASSTAACSAL